VGEIRTFGVIGTGVMGRGIAEVAATKGGFDRVVITDELQAQLDAAMAAIEKNLGYLADKGKLKPEEKAAALKRLTVSSDPAALAGCQFLVEAVPEKPEIKKKVLEAADRLLPEGAIIASNTSSIPITRLAALTHRPELCIGMHFMNPVPRMRGIEIIRGVHTSAETCRITLDLAKRFGKEITFSKDRAGFVINRILIPMLNDAAGGVGAGLARAEAVDKCFREEANGPKHPMGPLMLADLIGLDTVVHILRVLESELAPAYGPVPLLAKLLEKSALGAKSGSGFYLWSGGRSTGPNPMVAELAGAKEPPADGAALVARRAWLWMMNEAVRVVEEGTSSVADVDRGCLHCLNHPEGILAALDRVGTAKVLADLEALQSRFGAAYQPAPLLRRLVEAGLGGQATGAGVYSWDSAKPAPTGVNPVLAEYLK